MDTWIQGGYLEGLCIQGPDTLAVAVSRSGYSCYSCIRIWILYADTRVDAVALRCRSAGRAPTGMYRSRRVDKYSTWDLPVYDVLYSIMIIHCILQHVLLYSMYYYYSSKYYCICTGWVPPAMIYIYEYI